jgi:hypothetical protein
VLRDAAPVGAGLAEPEALVELDAGRELLFDPLTGAELPPAAAVEEPAPAAAVVETPVAGVVTSARTPGLVSPTPLTRPTELEAQEASAALLTWTVSCEVYSSFPVASLIAALLNKSKANRGCQHDSSRMFAPKRELE